MFLNEVPGELADAVFTRDPSLMTSAGAIVLRMGKHLRRGEEAAHARFYEKHDIPLLGTIEEPGTVEGGDCVWINDSMLVVGTSPKTK